MSYFQPSFIDSFNLLQQLVHQTAVSKGFWQQPRSDGESIALIHSELSEALEALRHDNPPDDKIPNFDGATAELADAVIRIMDLAEARRWPLAEAILAKAQFNETRPFKHDKAF